MKIINLEIKIVIIFAALMAIFFHSTKYIYNEGFNPTDEGVILAQSFRILNGEIPHKDFISIRPTASGYLHTINFILPGPCFVNARYFVLFQFFIITILTIIMLFKNFNLGETSKFKFFFISILIAGYTITILNYNLYSWTTIDAVFWSIISIYFLFNTQNKFNYIISIFTISIAALSRQTFALIAVILFIYVFFKLKSNFKSLVIIFFLGSLPLIAYFIMLLKYNALNEFITQMSGRTEFFQTAILQYIKRFLFCISFPFNLITLLTTIFLLKKNNSKIKCFLENYNVQKYISLFYPLLVLFLILIYFMANQQNIFTLPFELFFILFTLLFFHYTVLPKYKKVRTVSFFILLISWISSISLGDNTPVFSTGPLFISICLICIDLIINYYPSSKKLKIFFNPATCIIISFLIFTTGFISQRKFNYRDKPANDLIYGLGSLAPEFGKIKTNKNIIEYYSELKQIFDSLPNSKNNIIVFPHNAAFYPAFNTKNPFSLDWLIANEFIGQNNRINYDLLNITKRHSLYFIVDKYNVIFLSDTKIPIKLNDNIIYNFIIENFNLIAEYQYFKIYSLK